MKIQLIIILVLGFQSCIQIDVNKEIARGKRQYEADSLNESITTLTRVIQKVDTCSDCFLFRGFAFKELKKYDKAIKDFNSFIAISKDPHLGYANKGSVYYLENDYSNSLASFQKALELDPGSVKLYNPISHMLFATGKKDEACVYYTMALVNGDSIFDKQIVEYCSEKNNR
jgi:tetratricopeptide (TPR) repeat protein